VGLTRELRLDDFVAYLRRSSMNSYLWGRRFVYSPQSIDSGILVFVTPLLFTSTNVFASK